MTALPIVSILSIRLASLLQRALKNELLCSALLFAVGLLSNGLLALFFSVNAPVSVALMAVSTGCMHGINLYLVSRLPVYFRHSGRVSTVSGILNAFTYIGSGLSAYGIAALSERFGWRAVVTAWVAVTLAGTVLCALSVRKWKRFAQTA